MYRNCIFCSAAFGTNDALETFPVGHQLAFDSERGRLWAVCPSCSRWNLSPIEERWEAVEDAERLFRDARMRVQSENIGLARLPDGTRLVRVGRVVGTELAAWRYGTQLLRRRRRYVVLGGASAVAGLVTYGGLTAMGISFGALWGVFVGIDGKLKQRIVHRIDPGASGGERNAHNPIIVRRWHLQGMSLERGTDGQVQVLVRDAHRKSPGWSGEVNRTSDDLYVVGGDEARALLSRAMVHVNSKGASNATLAEANRLLADAGSAEGVLRDAALGGAALGKRAGHDPRLLKGPGALAFEMALNETAERTAMEGELAALEAAWREAEEIAGIADSIPGSATINRMLDRIMASTR